MKKALVPLILTVSVLLAVLTGCASMDTSGRDINTITSYKDIPEVTEDEISAIEALKEQRYRFTYGHLFETESFRLSDGTYAGFTIKLCELLSELFGKEFTPVHYYDWELLKNGIDELSIDFSGDFTTTSQQQEIYHMTTPIAGRTLNLYTYENSEINTESDVNGMRLGFLTGTVTAGIIAGYYPELTFETVEIAKTADAADMLRTGKIDAFVMDAVMDLEFERYDYIKSKKFFPLVHTPVSLTTANPELEPIISVVNKYLEAGGVYKLYELYVEGNYEYTAYKLRQSFTGEEAAYLKEITASGNKILMGIQHDAYPASFYNEMDEEFQGIAADILAEVSILTGLSFEPIISSSALPVSEVLTKLRSGEISMTTQLMYTELNKNDFIWSDTAYHISKCALLSRSDYPDLAMHEVYYVRVGTVRSSAHEAMFNTLFPEHENTVSYITSFEAFDALERGEIDLLMLSESLLLAQTNYREKPSFKVNIGFEKTVESIFGYNKNETLLRSIIDKSQSYIDREKISAAWLNRTFDYSRKIAQMQTVYVAVFAGAVLLIMAVLSWLLLKNKRLGKNLIASAAQARESSKAKSLFLANMSHKIRLPMNAIIGMSELLQSEQLSTRQERYIKAISNSSHSLLTIVDDILNFSKIEAGKLELSPVDYDFKSFRDNIYSIFEQTSHQKGLEFKYETEGVMPDYLHGDSIKLRQILTNLCENAAKFTAKGYVKLKIMSDGDFLEFEVEDTGTGIREESLSKLFDAFAQAEEQKSRSTKGTGLGLAISKAYAEMMDGDITVSSVYTKGTAFTLKIPIVLGNRDFVNCEETDETSFNASSARVLVVDDNVQSLKIASGLLGIMFSISAETAQSGNEAIGLIKKKDYDLVLIDHVMPEKDGIETVREIRAMGGKHKALKIAALSENETDDTEKMLIESGFNGFLTKPIATDRLSELLRNTLPAEKITSESGKGIEPAAGTPGKTASVRKFSESHGKAFERSEVGAGTAEPDGTREFLLGNVRTALDAADDFDADAAVVVVDKMLEYSYDEETTRLLKGVKAALLDFDFGSASDALGSILEREQDN